MAQTFSSVSARAVVPAVRTWYTKTWVAALVVGLAVAAVQIDRAASGFVSPYDEGYHLSYVQYVNEGALPRVGDPLNSWSREAFSCHPVFPYGTVTSVPCGELASPRFYPEGGTNTAAGWPPPYYAYTAAVTRLAAVFGVEPLYGARFASVLLWAVGAAALVLVARRFGANLAAAVSAGLAAGLIPVANTLGAFVTPHSAQLLLSVVVSATALHLMDRAERLSRRDVLIAFVVPSLAVFVVPHALVAVTIAYGALAAHWGWRALRSRSMPHRAWALAAAPLLAVAIQQGWELVVDARATEYPADVDASRTTVLTDPRGDSLVRPLLAEWWHFWPGGLSGDPAGFGPWELFVAMGAVMLVAGAVGIALLSDDPSPLARSLAIGLVVGAPITAWAAERLSPFDVPARYGASVIGVGLLLVALTVARRPSRPLLVVTVALWAMAFVVEWP